VTFFIYGISISVALSPIGEVILRLIENCRKPATKAETGYLMPLFEEVFESAKEIDPKLNDRITLYMIDIMHVDSFAIGRETIVITKGAMATFTEDELKGVLAHELGHMSYGHTKAKLLVKIGNIFFTAMVWVCKLLWDFIQRRYNVRKKHNSKWGVVLSILVVIARFLFDTSVFLFVTLSEIILALNSRANETQADTFAYNIGYGEELTSSLYLLQKIAITGDTGIMERAKATYPHIAYRIRHLEQLEDGETEEESLP